MSKVIVVMSFIAVSLVIGTLVGFYTPVAQRLVVLGAFALSFVISTGLVLAIRVIKERFRKMKRPLISIEDQHEGIITI